MRRVGPAAAILLALLAPLAAHAQTPETVPVEGRVVHGVEGSGFDPTSVRVSLNVLEGVTSLPQLSATPGDDGAFAFDVALAPARTYFFRVEYQGAAYSEIREADGLGDPVVLTVYDSTHDTSVLAVESYTVIVAGADPEEGFVEILERAIVRNGSNFTLVPDQNAEGPAMMSFLRFALPPNAFNLDVQSNLVGGQVLEVDRGFALTTPIVPTPGEPHQFEFVYRLNYDDAELDLSRTMRFGAESFRFVAPEELASLASPRLDDLGVAELNGRRLRLLESQNVAPAEFVELHVSGLPMRSGLDRALDSAGAWYVRYAVPGAVAVAAAALLIAAATRRGTAHVDPEAAREELMRRARALAEAYEHREITRDDYERRSRTLRDGLINLELDRRLRDAEGSGRKDH